jgi:hypothetical protein
MPRNGTGRGVYVPPTGALGANQQTQAGQAALVGGSGPISRSFANSTPTRRRRSKRRVKKSAATRRRRSSPGRLVKGSRAAKAFMAKLRRKRRK